MNLCPFRYPITLPLYDRPLVTSVRFLKLMKWRPTLTLHPTRLAQPRFWGIVHTLLLRRCQRTIPEKNQLYAFSPGS